VSLLCVVLWFVKWDVKPGSSSEMYPALSSLGIISMSENIEDKGNVSVL